MWWSIVSKAAERSNKRRTEMLSLSRAERISFYLQHVTKWSLCCVLLNRLTERGCWCFLGDGSRGKFVENNFFKDFEQKWDGSFSKDFCQVMAFSTEV